MKKIMDFIYSLFRLGNKKEKVTDHKYITCAAIWYKELPKQTHLPKNIETGVVVCGHRHSNCIDIVKTLSGLRSVQYGKEGVGESIQGFLTNRNRFVDRLEALQIALTAEQVKKKDLYNPKIGLFSEDLY